MFRHADTHRRRDTHRPGRCTVHKGTHIDTRAHTHKDHVHTQYQGSHTHTHTRMCTHTALLLPLTSAPNPSQSPHGLSRPCNDGFHPGLAGAGQGTVGRSGDASIALGHSPFLTPSSLQKSSTWQQQTLPGKGSCHTRSPVPGQVAGPCAPRDTRGQPARWRLCGFQVQRSECLSGVWSLAGCKEYTSGAARELGTPGLGFLLQARH